MSAPGRITRLDLVQIQVHSAAIHQKNAVADTFTSIMGSRHEAKQPLVRWCEIQ